MTDTRMTDPAPLPAHAEWTFLGDAQIDQLAGLIFELAGQLHVERARICVLEEALKAKGVLDPAAIESAATDPQVIGTIGAGLDLSLSGLLRVLTEDDDARTPLRGDARGEH